MKNEQKIATMKKKYLHTAILTRVFLILILILISISNIYALEFDNIKSIQSKTFDNKTSLDIPLLEKYPPLKIDNLFGLGKTLFEGYINEHTESCGIDCKSNIKIKLNKKGSLIDDIRFLTINEDGSRKLQDIREYNFYIKIGVEEIEVEDYELICSPTGKLNVNGTAQEECINKLVGTHIETNDLWKIYNIGEEVDIGIYEIKLEGKKKPSRTVDWQIKTQGFWTEEWASWGESSLTDSLVSYYSFDTNGEDITDNTNDCFGNAVHRNTGGKLNGYYVFSGAEWLDCSGDFPTRLTKDFTISFWFNTSVAGAFNSYGGMYQDDAGTGKEFQVGEWGDNQVGFEASPSGGNVDGSNPPYLGNTHGGSWGMITLTYNGTTFTLWDNSSVVKHLAGSGDFVYEPTANYTMGGLHRINPALDFTGSLDEYGIWNRSLTSTEISTIYNNGTGLPYTAFGGGSVTLNSPENNYISSINSINFNCSVIVGDGATLTNISLWHNGTGTWERNYTNNISGTSNESTFNISLPEGNTLWTCSACDSDGDCGFAIENRTLNIDSIYPIIDVEYPIGIINYGVVGNPEYLNVTFNDTNLDSCWYNYNGTNVSILGCISGIKNSTTFILETDNYNMTLYVNDTAGNLNSTFISWGYSFFEDSYSYTSKVYETDSQTFYLKITSSETIQNINALLNYNNTNYTATALCSLGSCGISSKLDIPLVSTGSQENKTFYWILNLYNGTSASTLTTSKVNQSVDRIYLEQCNATYTNLTLNFTFYNEQNLTKINDSSFDGLFQYYYGSGNVKRNLNISNSSTEEVNLCIYPTNKSMNLTGQIQYGTTQTNLRDYYFSNYLINNISKNIYLYLLDSSQSVSFILKVEDQSNAEVEGAYIYIQRYYPGDNTYKTVQIAKTDNNGKTIGFYETETINYKHLIYLNDVLELETIPGKIVPESTPYTITFKIGNSLSSPLLNFEELDGITTNLSFNKNTKIVSYSWLDINGNATYGRLVIYLFNNTGNRILFTNQTINFPSGSIVYNLSDYNGTFEAYGFVKPSSTISEKLTDILKFVIGENLIDLFGNTGLIIGFFIILTATLIFVWNPTTGIIMHNIATIFVYLIGFIDFGLTYIFSMIAISILIIIYMKT